MARSTWKETCRRAALVIWSAAAATPLLSGQPGPQDMDSLLNRLSQKVKVSSDYKSWRASVVSTITKTDKDWTPEEITVVTKTIESSAEGEPQEKILKALQTKNGKTTDITRKYAEERRKEREKYRKRRAREEKAESDGDQHDRGAMSLDEFLPFSEKKRQDYEFRLQTPPVSEGPAISVLEARAKVKSLRNWEGMFSFDPETYDLIKVDLHPSQNPKLVKELSMQIDFEVLNNRYLGLKRTQFKVNGGIFIKHVRQIVEDVYGDFEVLDQRN
jgi:Skp family chaperone for outer membrane proteins